LSGRYVWTYDQLGQIATEMYVYGNVDEYSSNTIVSTYYEYDDQGNKLVTSRRYKLRAGGIEDGGVSSDYYIYTYDPDGNVIKIEYDEGNDGRLRETWAYTYGAEGRLATEEWDMWADGDIDKIYTYTYDENGNLASSVCRSMWPTEYLARTTYTYDENGCLVNSGYDSQDDGTVESFTVYTRDPHCNPLTDSSVSCGDDGTECGKPRLHAEYSYIYDLDGNMLFEERRNASGWIQYRHIFAHYPDGKLWMEEGYTCFSPPARSKPPPFPWPG
jgi:hypothetical protein